MIPIPQYPLYSALIAKLTGTQVDYHLDEDNNWAASKETLSRQLNQARMNGIDVKALVIINPGKFPLPLNGMVVHQYNDLTYLLLNCIRSIQTHI